MNRPEIILAYRATDSLVPEKDTVFIIQYMVSIMQ